MDEKDGSGGAWEAGNPRPDPAEVLAGWDVVCFANDWEGDPLSKKHFMRQAARHVRVLWVDSIGNRTPTASARDLWRIVTKLRGFLQARLGEAERNIHVLRPLALPFYGNSLVRGLNRSLLGLQVRQAARRLGFRRILVWTFAPSSAPVIGTLGERAVLYHCVDEFSAFSGTPAADIADLEERLARKADLVVVCSEPLLRRKRPWNPRTFLVRHGVDVAHFRKALDPTTPVPPDLLPIPGPRVGFFGLLADWVDLRLLRGVADLLPEASFVLLGNATTDLSLLRGVRNVHLLGRRPYETLPGYARGFDVAVLPFRRGELTEHANPLKLREYLAAGLPVVATPIPEAARLSPPVRLAGDPETFAAAIREALAEGPGPSAERAALMAREGWDERFRDIIAHLAPLLRARRSAGT